MNYLEDVCSHMKSTLSRLANVVGISPVKSL